MKEDSGRTPMRRLAKRLSRFAHRFRRRSVLMPSAKPVGRVFVSYAYGDDGPVRALHRAKLGAATLNLFEPIEVPPSEMVSEKLVTAIRACDSLVYVDTPRARESPWVTLESDYAKRNEKPVFRFDAKKRVLELDDRPPLDLPVYASYATADSAKVREIARFMKRERSFDLFLDEEDLMPGEEWVGAMQEAVSERLDRGGYLVAFWSREAASSKPIRQEIESALARHSNRVLIALLEDVPPPSAPHDLERINLHQSGSSELDRRHVDNLIVRIYWLMQEHHRKNT